MIGHILKKFVEDVEKRVGDFPYGVFERPDDRVEDELDFLGSDAEERVTSPPKRRRFTKFFTTHMVLIKGCSVTGLLLCLK